MSRLWHPSELRGTDPESQEAQGLMARQMRRAALQRQREIVASWPTYTPGRDERLSDINDELEQLR